MVGHFYGTEYEIRTCFMLVGITENFGRPILGYTTEVTLIWNVPDYTSPHDLRIMTLATSIKRHKFQTLICPF